MLLQLFSFLSLRSEVLGVCGAPPQGSIGTGVGEQETPGESLQFESKSDLAQT